MSMKWMGLTLSIMVGSATWAEPPKPTPPKPMPPKSTPALLQKGKASYATNCLACHGEKGDGAGPAGMHLVPKPRNFVTEPFKKGNKPEEVFQVITNGLPASTMVAFSRLPEEERWALTYYVLEFQPKAKPADAKGTAGKKGKK